MKSSMLIYGATAFAIAALAAPLPGPNCEQTDVLILGAGSSGIAAGKQLAMQNVTKFIMLEYNSEVGGRVRHASFGQKPDRSGSYTIEQGANWIHGAGNSSGTLNPISPLAKKHGLKTVLWDISNIASYNESGSTDLTDEFARFDKFSDAVDDSDSTEEHHESFRATLRKAGWNSDRDPDAQAAEWISFDFDYAVSPDVVDFDYGDEESPEPQPEYGDRDDFVLDDRGYNYILRQELDSYMGRNDTRLHLNTIVSEVSVGNDTVIARTAHGKCFQAKHAIVTFSIGVLQSAALGQSRAPVTFNPPLPKWKQAAIAGFGMTIYTKIYFQFPNTFWPTNVENFLYASPTSRGYYAGWQSLSLPGYLPESNIIFATVTTDQSRKVEAQSDEETKAEALDVLRNMFGEENVPEPLDFFYPRWGYIPWAFGSYSYWPTGFTGEQFKDLRANVGRLWFAGEALAEGREATVDGAWSTGEEVGGEIAMCLRDGGDACLGWKRSGKAE